MFKVLIISAFLSVSVEALACPDLAGIYSCKYPSQTIDLEIQQTKNTFSVRVGEEKVDYTNDKKTKVEKAKQYGIETVRSQTGSCSGNSMIVDVVISQSNDLQQLSSHVNFNIIKVSANNVDLKIKAYTTTNGSVDGDSLVDTTIPCTKK